MRNVLDLDNLTMQAREQDRERYDKFMADWMRPQTEAKLSMMLKQVPQDVLANMPPDVVKKMQDLYGGKND
jgi:hypothetical protein